MTLRERALPIAWAAIVDDRRGGCTHGEWQEAVADRIAAELEAVVRECAAAVDNTDVVQDICYEVHDNGRLTLAAARDAILALLEPGKEQ